MTCRITLLVDDDDQDNARSFSNDNASILPRLLFLHPFVHTLAHKSIRLSVRPSVRFSVRLCDV